MTFDPYPWGCPIGIRATPSDMPELVSAVCLKLRDVLRASIYVINPSRGQSYPVLFLHGAQSGNDPKDGAPLLALFPEYEDGGRRRRVDYSRQTTLLQRIAEAGVPGETFESYRGLPSARVGAGPVELPLATDGADMEPVVHDVFERLGELLRITVTRVWVGEREIPVLRMYVLDDERHPRLLVYPGSVGGRPLDQDLRDELLGAIADRRANELPIEALFAR